MNKITENAVLMDCMSNTKAGVSHMIDCMSPGAMVLFADYLERVLASESPGGKPMDAAEDLEWAQKLFLAQHNRCMTESEKANCLQRLSR